MPANKKQGFTHDDKKNKTVDWWTPKYIFDAMRLTFDLDPAAPPGGVPWIPAKKFYTEKEDGLKSPWKGRVWLNPPYGDSTPAWLEKMHRHRNGVALVFARTDTLWFHQYIVQADSILFLKGRIKFVDGLNKAGKDVIVNGEKKRKLGGAGAGSMLAAWGAQNVLALEHAQAKLGGFMVHMGGD